MSRKMPADRPAARGLNCTVNGMPARLAVSPSRRLHAILRDDLRLTGTKTACEVGRCGACMVLVDGEPMNACLLMAYQCEGKSITTIEGLGNGELDAVQRRFLEEGGYQCGYCTPGMIVSVKALLDAIEDPSDEEISEALSGNLCRCTGYGGIWRSVRRKTESEGGPT